MEKPKNPLSFQPDMEVFVKEPVSFEPGDFEKASRWIF